MEAALLPDRVALSGCNPFAVRLAFSLARRGVRAFTLVDPRVVTAHELIRVPVWPWSALGRYRADALAEGLGEHFPALDVRTCRTSLKRSEAVAEVSACDLLVICDLRSAPDALRERLPTLRLYPLQNPPQDSPRSPLQDHGTVRVQHLDYLPPSLVPTNDTLADDILAYWRRHRPPPNNHHVRTF